ncbi:alpha/beta hydrolase [Hymenobacter sp. NBH84]|uniref:alpha/beta hydrolase family protein n=1 Tax=Hymenobacter sp. NBH84 TaxID=2596915 RepID=UPI0016254022|nr:alpha/beta hydrolase [Hymenobacter sp. NBH84]QNE41667.1 alpha/beta hydrolase [Hymenobacter sp. NBH84]
MRFSSFGSLLVALLGASTAFGQRPTANLSGQWSGNLLIPTGATLQLQLNVQDQSGRRTATLDIPTQNARNIAVDRVETKGDSLLLTVSAIRARFAGKVAPDGSTLRGFWRQNNAKLPLTFQHTSTTAATAAAPAAKRSGKAGRPQEPQAPFSYQAEEVRFTNKSAGVTLAGTLTLPPGKGPFPAAVLLTGSGPQDRDEAVFGHKPFLVLADYLTQQGIAVLRFDDRGVGKSTGNATTATLTDYTQDAEAAMAFLRSRPDINAKKVGAIGHSEGGTAGVRTASQAQAPAFLVLLGMAGVPGSEAVVQQALANARLKTKDPKILAGVEQRQRALIAISQRVADVQQAQKQMIAVLMPDISLPAEQMNQLRAAAAGQAAAMTTPAFRALLVDNPTQTLRAVKCPVLALGGAKDMQVISNTNLASIEKTLKSSGNRDVTTRELPGLNHMFQTAPTGAISEYGQIEETFSPAAMQAISSWILSRTK